MNRSPTTAATVVALLFAVAPALSAEQLELTMVAEKEVTVRDDTGETRVERVRPDLVVPGEEVIYTISYANPLAEPADNVVITNPLPEHMTYSAGTAEGVDTEILFSVDGSRFDRPGALTVRVEDGTERPATVEDYTHIRWLLKASVLPGATGQVSYRARLQ